MPLKWELEKIRELNREVERLEREVDIELKASVSFGSRIEGDNHTNRLTSKEKQLLQLQKKLNIMLNKYAKYKGYA